MQLTKAGVGTVLGAAEVKLMVVFAEDAKKGSPYMEEDIAMIIRTTLMTMELKNPVTKKPYTETSDVSRALAGFLDRRKGEQVCARVIRSRRVACCVLWTSIGRSTDL